MMGRLRLMKVIPVVFLVAMSRIPSALGKENCDTVLSRVAKAAAEKAINENRETACSGIKKGPLGIDKTKALELKGFQLCEKDAVVTAHIEVRIECATSDNAVIRTSVSDKLSAKASADLDSCTVSEDTQIRANGDFTRFGLNLSNANQKFKEAVKKEIQPYCIK